MLRNKDGLEVRYNKEAWLRAALEVLARDGRAKLRTERLAEELGVTRGSFYHHFKSKADFEQAVVEFWSKEFTKQTNERIASLDKPADQRLLHLMRMIRDNRLDRYDIAFRSWAAQDPAIAEQVRKVDKLRYEFVRSMFIEMGFTGDDLEERVRLWLVYECAQHTVTFPKRSRGVPDSVERRFTLITGLSPSKAA